MVSSNDKVIKQQLQPIGRPTGQLVLNKHFVFPLHFNINAQHPKRLHELT